MFSEWIGYADKPAGGPIEPGSDTGTGGAAGRSGERRELPVEGRWIRWTQISAEAAPMTCVAGRQTL